MKLLEGIKVVELGTYLAVPQVARMMCDWGANVIKVEPPRGEGWRTIGRSYDVPCEDDCNPVFQTPNAGKRDIAINLKTEQGMKVMLQLLEDADVFLTNTRLNGLKKLGLAYEDICGKFPRLIYAHFGGYGEFGPEKDRPGFDIAAYWAKAGMPLEWSVKESGSVCRPLPGFGDSTVASVVLSGVLAALYGRINTGKGDFLKASLYGSALWFNSCGVVQAQYRPQGSYPLSRYDQATPYNIVYQTADDDFFFFSIPTWDRIYMKFLTMIHLEEYIGDERLATLEACRKNMRFAAGLFDDAFRKMSTNEVKSGFNSMDCVFEIVADPQSIAGDEQAWANNYLRKVTMENGSQVVLPNPPVQFLNTETAEFKLAPKLGENSGQILKELGYGNSEIESMFEAGIVVSK